MIRIHSFDIFDTLLTRPLLRPSSLFHIVGTRLVAAYPGVFTASEFYAARCRAESRARKAARPRDDCRFDEIYAHFPELAVWAVAPSVAMAAELECERAAIRPIAATVAEVQSLAARGEIVVFLSDMYLPTEFIQDLLDTHVLPVAQSSVFVSGDLGLSKRSGRLFEHVLSRFEIAPTELCHHGDNPYSDIAVPRRLGIVVSPRRDIVPNRYERLRRPRRHAPLWLVGAGGAARATRLSTPRDAEDRAIHSLASNVVAPILTAYVAWVLDRARSTGIERIYFVARDGQIFLRIAEELRRDGDPECRYLYGSRHTWFLPSVLEPSQENLEWAWLGSMSRTGEAILRRLEINVPEVRALLSQHGFESGMLEQTLVGRDFERFRDLLLDDPLAGRIRTQAAFRRQIVDAYLRQEGLYDDCPWALVDVGWSLRSQRALARILHSGGFSRQVRGFYFGISAKHVPLTESGPAHAFVVPGGSDLRAPLVEPWFFRSVLLVEHLFTVADHPTTRNYRERDGRIQPEFMHDDRNAAVIDFARRMHASIQCYAREIATSTLVDPASEEFRLYAAGLMRKFCVRPERTDVSGIAWLPTNKDQSHDASLESRIAAPLTLRDLSQIVGHLALRPGVPYFSPRFTWILGSAALSSFTVRHVCRALYTIYVIVQARPRLRSILNRIFRNGDRLNALRRFAGQ